MASPAPSRGFIDLRATQGSKAKTPSTHNDNDHKETLNSSEQPGTSPADVHHSSPSSSSSSSSFTPSPFVTARRGAFAQEPVSAFDAVSPIVAPPNHPRSPTAPSSALATIADNLGLAKLYLLFSQTHKTQTTINARADKLHALNFYLSYTNAVRSKKMAQQLQEVRVAIHAGLEQLGGVEASVASHASLIQQLETSLKEMDEGVERQAQVYAELTQAVESQRADFEASLGSQERRLQAQESTLQAQESTLRTMMRHRFRMDAGVDLTAACLALYLCRTWPVDAIVGLLARGMAATPGSEALVQATKQRHRIRVFARLVRVVTFLLTFSSLRREASRLGLHSSQGNLTLYGEWATETLREQLRGWFQMIMARVGRPQPAVVAVPPDEATRRWWHWRGT